MPNTNFHTARITDPDKYEKIRRVNDKFGAGIDVNFGVLKNGDTEVQSIYFDKSKFTASQAKEWLKDNKYKPIEFVPATEKSKDQNMEYKVFPFRIIETKDGGLMHNPYGTIKGYASTYGNVDRANDLIMEGAFNDSLEDYKNQNRMIKVYYQHNTQELPIGGITPDNIGSDKSGLPVIIDINKSVQRGNEVYSLAKQGVLSDMSIGYTVNACDYSSDGVRVLKNISLWEVSIVGEPANPMAKVSEVKSSNKYKFYNITDLKNILTKKDLEDVLRESGAFSKEAATFLAANFIEKKRGEPVFQDNKRILNNLSELKTLIQQI